MYTLSSLSTKADCDILITIANREKADLVYRKSGLDRQTANVTLTALEIEASMQAIEAELSALESILSTLPPGPTYDDNLVKKTKAEYRKFLLEQRRGNYGPIALVQKEYDVECINKVITETDAFIAALIVRKDELPA